MPKLPIDYSNTIIYKLVHKDDLDDENIYIGSTTNFKQRKNHHRHSCNYVNNKDHNAKKYQFIRENGGWDNWVMIEIEKYPCKDLNEVTARERYWKRELNATLNMIEPQRSKQEYYIDNKEKILEYKKIFHQEHKQEKNAYNKKYNQDNREKISIQRKSKYYENIEEIKEKRSQKVKCNICACEVTKNKLKRHQQTKKCQTSRLPN